MLNKANAKSHKRIPSASGPPQAGGAAKALNNFQMTENNNIVISSAKGIGCSVVNIGPTDLIEGREHLVLGLIWQIIRKGLLSKIDIKLHPELYRLLEDGESLEQFLRLPPDQILLRWFNFHLKAAGWQRRCAIVNCAPREMLNALVLESTTSRRTFRMAKTTQSCSISSSPISAPARRCRPETSINAPRRSVTVELTVKHDADQRNRCLTMLIRSAVANISLPNRS